MFRDYHSFMTVLLLLVTVVLINGGGQIATGAELVAEGQSNYTIVIGPDSSPSQLYAAEELQKFLELISGAELPISEQPAAGPMIFVGRSDALDALSLDIDYDALGEEGLVMKTAGPHLVLTGGRQRGTLYAVYEFLDKHLGCRWYTSGGATPPVSRIPHRQTIVVGPIDETKIPPLEYRSAWYAEAFDGDWAARNRLNGTNTHVTEKHGGKIRYYRTQAWHTFNKFVAPSEIDEHPDYFALVDGQRKKSQLCTSNPAVVQRTIEEVRRWLSEDPKANFVSVVANDTHGFCRCELCGPLIDYEMTRAAPVLHLANQVADNIKEEFPHVMVDTLAYSPTAPMPRYVRARDNVVVRLATAQACRVHPLSADCGDSWYLAQMLVTWSKRCDRLYVWDYVTNYFHLLMPYPNLHTLQPNIKYFVDNNVKGIFAHGCPGGGGEFAELRSYLLARCFWYPETDWKQEMAEFLQAYYGPAAEPIQQYIDMMQRKVESGLDPVVPQPTDILCSVSGKPMFKLRPELHRFGKPYPYLACDNLPLCKGVLAMNGDEETVILPQRPPLRTEVKCATCGEPLDLQRSFRYGPWLNCSAYPDCSARTGWSTLTESQRATLEKALTEHEHAHPVPQIRNAAGEVFDADGKPLQILNAEGENSQYVSRNRLFWWEGLGGVHLAKPVIHRAEELFDEAEAAVADAPVLLRRVKKERLGIDYVKISRQGEFLPSWQEYEQAVEKFVRFAKEWKIDYVSESALFEGRFEQWRAKAKELKQAAGASDG